MSILRMLAASNVPPYVPPVQQYVTLTFTTATTWTAPANVSNLVTVSGKGDDGSPAERIPQSGVAVSVSRVQGYGGDRPGSITWQFLTLEAKRVAESLNNSAGPYWNEQIYQQFNDAYTNTAIYHLPADVVGGSAKIIFPFDWQESGPVNGTQSGLENRTWTATVSYQTWGPVLGGQPSFGFDNLLYFQGGYGGAATPSTKTNVQITPGKTYSVSIGGNGYITISYYQ